MRVTRSSAVRRSASEAVARASRAAFAARSASVGDRHALDVHVGRRQQGGPDRGPGGEPVDLRLLGRVVGRLLAQGALRGGEQGVGAGRERRPPDGDVVPERVTRAARTTSELPSTVPRATTERPTRSPTGVSWGSRAQAMAQGFHARGVRVRSG